MALIVMTTFGNINFARLSIESLQNTVDWTQNRFILIDNNKDNITANQLKEEFSCISEVIINEVNSQPVAFNIGIKRLQSGEDWVYIPNDVVFTASWLQILKEDMDKYPHIGIGSPYIPFDLQYDEVLNNDFNNRFMVHFRPRINKDLNVPELKNLLNEIYYGDFEEFAENFEIRNKDINPLDASLTHIMYIRNWVFDKIGLFDERYSPYGAEDNDFFIRANNAEIFRLSSSRTFVHHWLSVTANSSIRSDIQKQAHKNAISILQRWRPIVGSVKYNKIPRCQYLYNWHTKYRKFERLELELDYETASKTPGTRWMLFDGLKPGENYFDQIQVGSIIRFNKKYYTVMHRTQKSLTIRVGPNESRVIFRQDYKDLNAAVSFYWRKEEPNFEDFI